MKRTVINLLDRLIKLDLREEEGWREGGEEEESEKPLPVA